MPDGLKSKLRTILPSFLLDAYRELKLKAIYEGGPLACPFCGRTFRKFKPHGLDVPILRELEVVSGGVRPTTCPRCNSNDRERLILLYLQRHTDLFKGGFAILDIAPSDTLAEKVRAIPNCRYVSGDLLRTDVMEKVDITNMQFEDASFDVILCNHVMEHVPDDRKGMKELRRVLKPGGWAMVLTPYSRAIDKTREDFTLKTDAERLAQFGQEDHVRIYSFDDYLERLRESGLTPQVIPVEVTDEEVDKFALLGERDIIIGKRES